MKVDVLGPNGSSSDSIELNEKIFGVKVSSGSIYYKLRNELANARQGTAKTKGRSEVSYSGRKPWRQKGTGRARAGDRRSPIWVGGGTVFGPLPRDYSYTLPKKIKRLAFKSILSKSFLENILTVIEDISSTDGKTKSFLKQMHAFALKEQNNVVLIVHEHDVLLKRAARNIPWLKILVCTQLLLKDLFYAKRILITKSAAQKLNTLIDEKVGT